jgi:hypothetical protein
MSLLALLILSLEETQITTLCDTALRPLNQTKYQKPLFSFGFSK